MLTKGFFDKKYNSIMFAALLGWLASLIGDLADSILGGIFISEEAVSATGLVAPIYSISFFLSLLMAIGAENKYANYVGAFDKENAYRVAGNSIINAIIFGILMATAMYFGEDLYFAFYSTNQSIEILAREYYRYYIFIVGISPLFWSLYYLVYGDGDAGLILSVDIVSAFGNALISILLVTKLGIKGLALGTVGALLINYVQLIPHFFSKRNSLRFNFKYSFKLSKEMAISGSSTSLFSLYIGIVDIIMNKFVIVAFGSKYLATYAVVNLIINLAAPIASATDGAGPFIGVAYGENNTVMLKKALNKCLRTAIEIALVFTIIFELCANYIPYIYGIENPDAFKASVYCARIIPLFFIFKAYILTWTASFSKIDKPLLGNIVIFLSELLTPIILGVSLGKLFGFEGLVWGLALSGPLTVAIVYIILIYENGKGAFPFGIKDSSNKIFVYELKICDKEIVELQKQVENDLTTCNIEKSLIQKISLTIEETLQVVKNKNNKQVLGDCTIIVDDRTVSLTTRDNGVIFDITKESQELRDLRGYVISRIMDTNLSTKYLTTTSFNRNNFVWEK